MAVGIAGSRGDGGGGGGERQESRFDRARDEEVQYEGNCTERDQVVWE